MIAVAFGDLTMPTFVVPMILVVEDSPSERSAVADAVDALTALSALQLPRVTLLLDEGLPTAKLPADDAPVREIYPHSILDVIDVAKLRELLPQT